MYTTKEAIAKMRCKERECIFLDPEGKYTFCTVLRTDHFCLKRDKIDRIEFYKLAEKYGFCGINNLKERLKYKWVIIRI